jgi:hypothetical protein
MKVSEPKQTLADKKRKTLHIGGLESKTQALYLHFLKHDALGVGRATEGVGSVLGAQVRLVVLLISPALSTAAGGQLASSPDSTRLAHLDKELGTNALRDGMQPRSITLR